MFIKGMGRRADYLKDSDDVFTLVAAHATLDRNVILVVQVTETFDDGDGAQPTFIIGETGDANKFMEVTEMVDLTEGDKRVYAGTLAATKSLIVTGTAATEDATGSIKVRAVIIPLSL